MPKKSHIIGGVIIALAMAMAMYSFKSTLTPYVTVGEAKASKRPVQVAGIAVKGTERYDLKTNNFLFTLREDGGAEMLIEYDGPRPGNFDDATMHRQTQAHHSCFRRIVDHSVTIRTAKTYSGHVSTLSTKAT